VNREEKLRKAYASANAILALEGWEPTPDALAIQERVIMGELTHDEGVQMHIAQALSGRLSK
jgi:hypothetical protein